MKTISPEPVSLMEVVDDFLKGEIVIPSFQRDFVWSIQDVKDLMDSIYNHYPIGSIILWEETKNLDYIKEIGNIKCKESTKPVLHYILDGQQRIASIVAAVMGAEIKNKKYQIFFDLDDKVFVTENEKKLDQDGNLVNQISDMPNRYILLPDLLDKDKIFDTLEKTKDVLSESRKKNLREAYHRFNDYTLSIIKIKDMNINKVCEVFERINTKGKTLTVVDLMIARTSQSFDLRNKLKRYREKLVNSGFDEKLAGFEDNKGINNKNILQAISAHITGRCHREDILGLSANIIKERWGESINAMDMAIDFIKTELNIKNARILPFSLLIVPLSYFFLKIKSPSAYQVEELKRWFWDASLSNRYDSGIDTKIAEDIKEMIKLISNNKPFFNYYYDFDYNRILNQRLSIGNAFCKTILSLLAFLHPKDLKNNSEIDLNGVFSKYNAREMHHIFSVEYLKKNEYAEDQINNIANICFLPSKQNKDIGTKMPKDYIKELEDNNPKIRESLKSHLLDFEELENMEFEQFLQSRAKRMESELKILAGLEKQDNVNSLLTPETPFSNNSYFRNILFSCRGFIYWMDKYFSKRGLDYLIDFIDPKQIKEIKIIMSLESFTPVFKEAFIDFREEMTNKNVSIQLKIINKSNLKSRLHDRFIISKDDAFNIPSPDVLARGQLSEISKSNNRTKILKEFDDLWDGCEDCFPDENKE